MMALSKRWITFGASMCVAVLVLAATTVAVSKIGILDWHDQDRRVQRSLAGAVSSGATTFDFASAAPFAWDRMYVFGCYTQQSDVEKSLAFKWPDYSKTSIESSDAVCLVVFVKSSQVVSWYEQPRSIEVGGLANGKGYARSEAKFQIVRDAGRASLEVSPAPSP